VASSDNQLVIPSRTVVGVGAREKFTLGKNPATVRVFFGNIFDNFGWVVADSSGMLLPNAQRSFLVNFYADF
jgi:hypothetical protein